MIIALTIAFALSPLSLSEVTDRTPPSKVTGLVILDTHNGTLNLSWNPATDNVGVDHYEVYRDDKNIASTTTTFYLDSGVVGDNEYSYTVRAVDGEGNEGELSDPVKGISTYLPDTSPHPR